MSDSYKDIALKYLTIAALLVILIGGVAMLYPNYMRGKALKRQNEELQLQIDRKTREIAELMENQRRFRTDADFVENIARQNHRVLPGEFVFIFNEK